MILKLKNKAKSILKKKFDVKRSKSFDLDSHLEDLEFYKDFENDFFCNYKKDDFYVYVNKKENTFSVLRLNNTLSKINFIPDSSMVLAMIVKLTLKKFETAAEEKRTN